MIKEESFIITRTQEYNAKKGKYVCVYWLINEDTQKRKKISQRKYERLLKEMK